MSDFHPLLSTEKSSKHYNVRFSKPQTHRLSPSTVKWCRNFTAGWGQMGDTSMSQPHHRTSDKTNDASFLKQGCQFGIASSCFVLFCFLDKSVSFLQFSIFLVHCGKGIFFVCFSVLFIYFSLSSTLFLLLSYFSATFPPGLYAKEAAFSSYSGSCCAEISKCVYETRKINVLVDEFHYLPNGPWKLMRILRLALSRYV